MLIILISVSPAYDFGHLHGRTCKVLLLQMLKNVPYEL